MSDILSQNEIDELLNALNTGEIDLQNMESEKEEKKIKNYDFKRPSKFAKEHIRKLNIIHDNYAKLMSNFLTGYLRTIVQIEVTNVETLTYSDFNNSIPFPAVLSIVEMNPLSGSIVFEMDSKIAYALIDRILGGHEDIKVKARDFTEIEVAIIERINTQIINLMKDPWESVIPIKPRIDRIETNSQFAQIIPPNEMVALVTCSVQIGEVEGMINICIPYMVVEPIIPKLSTKFEFRTIEKEITNETKKQIEYRIQETKVPLKAILGRTSVTVDEIAGLQIGDVLPLNTGISGRLDVMVGNLLKFHAKPGVHKRKYSLKITDVVREED